MKNNTPKYHILWQRWEDPVTKIKNQLNNQIRTQNINSQEFTSEYEKEYEGKYGDQSSMSMLPMHNFNAIPMVSTPMGMMPVPMPDMSSFNFWIGHTNFNITGPIGMILEQSLGVETFDLFSPYRFRIAIGKAFNETAVKRNIATSITRYFAQNNKHVHQKNNIPT